MDAPGRTLEPLERAPCAWRASHHVGLLLGIGLGLAACGEDEPTATAASDQVHAGAESRDEIPFDDGPGPDEVSRILVADDFLLRVHDYNWEIEGSVLYQVEASGRFVHVFPEDRREGDALVTDFREVTGTLDEDRVAALRALLDRDRFTALDEEYVDPDVEDGAMTNFYLRLDGVMQRVYCQNRFPDGTQHLLAWLREEATELDRTEARTLPDDEIPRLEWPEATAP